MATVGNGMNAFFRKRAFGTVSVGELLLLMLGAVVAGIWAFNQSEFNGSEFDTLLYLNIAMFPRAAGAILNRYAHIYLQKLFLVVFPDPLSAVKALWAFEIVATAVLVYLCAKLLNIKNRSSTPVLALIFFFAQRKLYATAGAPLIEFTLTLFLCAGILVYLLYVNSSKRSPWSLLALGLVQLLLFKTKESGLIFAPVVLAAAYLYGNAWRQRVTGLVWAAAGFAAGWAGLMALDAWLLGDLFFSLRPDSWRQLIQFNLTIVYPERSPLSWYDVMLATSLAIPILLSILALWNDERGELAWQQRVIWLLPILLVLFLSLTTYRAAFPQNFRYVYPCFALFAITGAQFFGGGEKESGSIKLIALSLGAALVAYYLLVPGMVNPALRWSEATILSNILPSFLVSFVLLALLVPKTFGGSRKLLAIPPVAVLLFLPMLHAPTELQVARAHAKNFHAPYAIYASKITKPAGASLFFTRSIYEEYVMLGRDSGSAENYFEAYFDTSVAHVGYSAQVEDVLLESYDYAFVLRAEVDAASLQDDLQFAGYSIHEDPRTEVLLLRKE